MLAPARITQARTLCAGRRSVWNRLVLRDGPYPAAQLWPSWGLLEEAEDGSGVEVEHLRAGELAVADSVQAQRFHVEPLAGRFEASLVPEHDDFLACRGDDSRVHAPFVPGRLQGVPDLVEAGP